MMNALRRGEIATYFKGWGLKLADRQRVFEVAK